MITAASSPAASSGCPSSGCLITAASSPRLAPTAPAGGGGACRGGRRGSRRGGGSGSGDVLGGDGPLDTAAAPPTAARRPQWRRAMAARPLPPVEAGHGGSSPSPSRGGPWRLVPPVEAGHRGSSPSNPRSPRPRSSHGIRPQSRRAGGGAGLSERAARGRGRGVGARSAGTGAGPGLVGRLQSNWCAAAAAAAGCRCGLRCARGPLRLRRARCAARRGARRCAARRPALAGARCGARARPGPACVCRRWAARRRIPIPACVGRPSSGLPGPPSCDSDRCCRRKCRTAEPDPSIARTGVRNGGRSRAPPAMAEPATAAGAALRCRGRCGPHCPHAGRPDRLRGSTPPASRPADRGSRSGVLRAEPHGAGETWE
jgi:hypothetical protein